LNRESTQVSFMKEKKKGLWKGDLKMGQQHKHERREKGPPLQQTRGVMGKQKKLGRRRGTQGGDRVDSLVQNEAGRAKRGVSI